TLRHRKHEAHDSQRRRTPATDAGGAESAGGSSTTESGFGAENRRAHCGTYTSEYRARGGESCERRFPCDALARTANSFDACGGLDKTPAQRNSGREKRVAGTR